MGVVKVPDVLPTSQSRKYPKPVVPGLKVMLALSNRRSAVDGVVRPAAGSVMLPPASTVNVPIVTELPRVRAVYVAPTVASHVYVVLAWKEPSAPVPLIQ